MTEKGVNLANGDFIPSELVVWAAGVKGPDVLAKLDGLEVSRSNMLVVKPTLQTTRDDNIFVIGDAAYLVPEGETAPVPPRAQAAHQEATHLVRQLQRRINGETQLTPFKYRDFGSLVSLGKYSTVGSLMGFISGKSLRIEGLVCENHVSLTLQDARNGAAWPHQGGARYALPAADAAHGAARQAALDLTARSLMAAARAAMPQRKRV